MLSRLWPASGLWRVVWVVVLVWLVITLVLFAASACVTPASP